MDGCQEACRKTRGYAVAGKQTGRVLCGSIARFSEAHGGLKPDIIVDTQDVQQCMLNRLCKGTWHTSDRLPRLHSDCACMTVLAVVASVKRRVTHVVYIQSWKQP